MSSFDPPEADRVFDGGDMDCGSGLILLLRQNLLETPEGGVLEMRSAEPTVIDELPPWCRMVGHEYLGTVEETAGQWRHFLRRLADESAQLEEDKQKARDYEWRVRVRSTGNRAATAYARNFSFTIGQPASFDESDDHPSALEHVLAALAADLVNGFATHCHQAGLEIDDLECTVKGRLHDVLAQVGISDGDPSLSGIDLSLFATSPEKGAVLRDAWESVRKRSPLLQTLAKSCDINDRFVVM
jgi:TusA-related sulfurtransferase